MILKFLSMCIFIVTTSASDFEHTLDFDSFFPKSCRSLNIEVECKFCNAPVSYMLLHKDDIPGAPLLLSTTTNKPPPEIPKDIHDLENPTEISSTKPKTGNVRADDDLNTTENISPTQSETGNTEADDYLNTREISPMTPSGIAKINDPTNTTNISATPEAGPITLNNDKPESNVHYSKHKNVIISTTNVAVVVIVCLFGAVCAFLLAKFVAKKISDRWQSGTYQVPEQTNAPI